MMKSFKIKAIMGCLLVFFCSLPLMALLGGGGVSSSSGELSEGGLLFSADVLKWKDKVEKECQTNGVPEALNYLLALIQVETGGDDTRYPDIMQCSESQGRPPNSISDPNESITVGVKYFADMYKAHKGTDLLNVVQAYNYGAGYLSYAKKAYSFENAIAFSREKSGSQRVPYINEISTSLGYDYRFNYGNMFYAQMVNQYLVSGTSSGGGSSDMVKVAQDELKSGDHAGGSPYWGWYGFGGRVEWCATFVSYIGYKAGVSFDKFAYCPYGITYFKTKKQWLAGGKTPKAGQIIFFDWEGDGVSDHVGIVEKVENGMVITIEGNSGDKLARCQYQIKSSLIVGYGTP